MRLYGKITDRLAWYWNLDKIRGNRPRGKGGPIMTDNEYREDYLKCMEMYWEELEKHLLDSKPFLMPYQLGAMELIRYKVSASRKSPVIDWGATIKYRKENPGSKRVITANHIAPKEYRYSATDNYKFLLRHLTFMPFAVWKEKGRWVTKRKGQRNISDDQPRLKHQLYDYNKSFSFLYKFRANSSLVAKLVNRLRKDPSRIYEIREVK